MAFFAEHGVNGEHREGGYSLLLSLLGLRVYLGHQFDHYNLNHTTQKLYY
jgi:hypothetical protein